MYMYIYIYIHIYINICIYIYAVIYDSICNRIRYLISVKNDITYIISHNYANIKVDSYN